MTQEKTLEQRVEEAERFLNFTKLAEIAAPNEASQTISLIRDMQARIKELEKITKLC